MKTNLNSKRVFPAMGLFFALFFGVMVIVSCEKDEVVSVKPPDTSGCDTSNVTFSGFVGPLINANCYCHTNGAGSGGVNLEGYANIKAAASNGSLLSSMRGSMKDYAGSDCNFLKVQAWVNKSAPND